MYTGHISYGDRKLRNHTTLGWPRQIGYHENVLVGLCNNGLPVTVAGTTYWMYLAIQGGCHLHESLLRVLESCLHAHVHRCLP